ncbi:hypothetical protein H2199_007924 [Coniosporium tulheliwenetii]|uniref:Uncharacterized protein n=1 Tax=Coniosporium tulheliwenetii TaxID=3383036 RepID=A0ACC2YLT0_9PEZI|nr:hypothetical protein H2199_007924 [Cladosporium sp. JES 115]
MYPFDYFQHWRDCQRKQAERASRIATPPKPYLYPLAPEERTILGKPIQELVQDVQKQITSPIDVLRAYGKVAIQAQRKTNCLTEIMLPEAEEWIEKGEINLKGPLAGIPVSLKDSVAVGGFDVSVGYSRNTGKPYPVDGYMVRILKDAGAVPFVKTNLPITLLSFESTNDVWGRTTNPHNPNRIGIGSDVAGSVRAPAHFSGCYSLRCSTGRWPKMGMNTSMPGQEGIPSVFSPMARTLNDLAYFTASFIGMEPWKYDHSVHPLAWRPDVTAEYREKKKLRVGVMRTDGVGHECFDVTTPSPYEALVIGSQLLNADGCRTFRSFFRTGEWEDPGAAQMSFYMALPRPFRYIHYLWVKYVRKDDVWAGLLKEFSEKSAFEQWKLVARREAYKARWHDWWRDEAKMDFMLTLDYTCGIIPVTHVDRVLDMLPASFSMKKLNGVAQGAYKYYDAIKMEGLPVGVQVVGQRLQEEKVLAVMERVEDALEKHGGKYELLEIE